MYSFSATVVTLVLTGAAGETIKMICTDGNSHPITSSTVFATLGIGWAAFSLSLIFNILYYALHPSQVTLITPWFVLHHFFPRSPSEISLRSW